jgi:hypothetical protein
VLLVVVVVELLVVVVVEPVGTVVVGTTVVANVVVVTVVASAPIAVSVPVVGGNGTTPAGSKAIEMRSSGANLMDAGFVVIVGFFSPKVVQ